VVDDIRSHSEELQQSIGSLSERLQAVAKEEQEKRDSIQEGELRAAVGEYDQSQWDSIRNDANRQMEKIAADRAQLEGQLAELESIRKLSEVTVTPGAAPIGSPSTAGSPSVSTTPPAAAPTPPPPVQQAAPAAQAPPPPPQPPVHAAPAQPAPQPVAEKPRTFSDAGWPQRDIVDTPVAAKPSAPPAEPAPPKASTAATDPAAAQPRPTATPPRAAPPVAPPRKRTPTGKDSQIATGFSKPIPTPPEGRPEVNKTLKCPECGTMNYPTEWYCERCGGELATM
jgi:hypothetical protein